MLALEETAPTPIESAEAAGLRYVTDAAPGIRRQPSASGFLYRYPNGREVLDPDERLRIKALAVPPAWTDVWICPDPWGHLQATGRDARGRKQYRYHARWREVRDEAKFERLAAFATALPGIRRRVDAGLRLPDLPRTKVLAAIVKLLETTLIRVGNDEYARDNASYGLTTLRDGHARINGSKVGFTFRGKSGKPHRIGLRDRRLARVVKRCRDIPGQRLFQYEDEAGGHHSVYSEDVNDYLREITGQDFSAKDFRTWFGTVMAATELRDVELAESKAQAKRNVTQAIESVAVRLGNTPAIAHKCYVHPAVIDAYLDGTLRELLRPPANEAARHEVNGLSEDELAVLGLLRHKQQTSAQ